MRCAVAGHSRSRCDTPYLLKLTMRLSGPDVRSRDVVKAKAGAPVCPDGLTRAYGYERAGFLMHRADRRYHQRVLRDLGIEDEEEVARRVDADQHLRDSRVRRD